METAVMCEIAVTHLFRRTSPPRAGTSHIRLNQNHGLLGTATSGNTRGARYIQVVDGASSAQGFPDHFSNVAALYSESRPTYPQDLFAWLAEVAPGHDLAWDCATGNGQAALGLAARFTHVVASDASPEQLSHATVHPRVEYRCFRAESPELADASVDVVTVAQALHWFDHDLFYAQVRRTLRPGGVIAAWTYGKFHVVDAPEITTIMDDFHDRIVWPYWPPERSHVDTRYANLDFPFDPIEAPAVDMRMTWNLDELLAYLGSWSSVSRYQEAIGEDPRTSIVAPLREMWGDPGIRRDICWSLTVLAGISTPDT